MFFPPDKTTVSPDSNIPLSSNFLIPAFNVSSTVSFASIYTGVTFQAKANWLNVLLLSVTAKIGHPAPNPANLLAESPECVYATIASASKFLAVIHAV